MNEQVSGEALLRITLSDAEPHHRRIEAGPEPSAGPPDPSPDAPDLEPNAAEEAADNKLEAEVRTADSEAPAPAARRPALGVEPEEAARQIRQALRWGAGEWREVRTLKPSQHAIVDSPEAAVTALKGLAVGADVFVTLNPVDRSRMPSDVSGQLKKMRKGQGANDQVITRRTRLLIDIDPVRKSKTSSTDEQLALAKVTAARIERHLCDLGWPQPAIVCSGNGYHLYFGVDVPGESTLVSEVLSYLDVEFSDSGTKVDTTVGNPARIVRLPGFINAKGGASKPSRVALLTQEGSDELVTIEQLERLVGKMNAAHQPPVLVEPMRQAGFDVGAFLAQHNVKHAAGESWPGGPAGSRRWALPVCPFNPDHKDSACAIQTPDGTAGFVCHHDSCGGFGWKDFRRVVELSAPVVSSSGREPFPAHALPPAIRDLAEFMERTGEADAGTAAVTALVGAMGMVGNAFSVHVWGQWREAMAAWMASVGSSGVQKTAAFKTISGALDTAQRRLAGGPLTDDSQFIVMDTTTEKAAILAAHQPRGLIVACSELSSHFSAMNQYKRNGSDEAFWLNAYDGVPHTVNRVKRESVHIPRLTASILGTIQPKVLADAVSRSQMSHSGALARYWLVENPFKAKKIRRPDPKEEEALNKAVGAYSALLSVLRQIPTEDLPVDVRVDKSGDEVIQRFCDVQTEMIGALPQDCVECAVRNKARGSLVRVAGLFAVIRAVSEANDDRLKVDVTRLRVTLEDLERAEQVVNWITGETVRLLRQLGMQDEANLLVTCDHKLRQYLDAGCLSVRDVVRRSGIKTTEVTRMLEKLKAAKVWGSRTEQNTNGGPGKQLWYPFGAGLIRT